jgi:3-phenylpropionate/trans-cinnamate dioxygenase ferredoxin subunit
MWHEVCADKELEEGDSATVSVEGESVAVFLSEDEVHAVSDVCTHAGASLSEGGVREGTVRCPRHGAPFDLRTGEALGYPASEDLRTYETKVEDGVVYVRVDEEV